MSNLPEFRHILVIEDQKSKRIVALKESTYSLGRDPSNTILIYDRQVSRHHATILRVTDYQNNYHSYRVIDGSLQGKRSTNGIIVNGKYCLSHELKHGDFIRFGSKSKISYQILSSASEVDLLKDGNTVESLSEDFSSPEQVQIDKITIATDSFLDLMQTRLEPEEARHPLLSRTAAQPNCDRASELAEYSPQAIIEVDFSGEITYVNPIAKIKFPDLTHSLREHPLLQGLTSASQTNEQTSFVREIQVEKEFFEQHIHYLADDRLIRTYLVDTTPYKRLEAKLQTMQERYHLFNDRAKEGMFIVDAESKKILEANRAYCQLLSYSSLEISQLNLYQIIALDRQTIDHTLEDIPSETSQILEESMHRCQTGSLVSVETQISRTYYGEKEIFCFVVRDISERKQSQEKLQYQSLHDPLTQLPNRALFDQQLAIALAHARRHQHLLAVMFLDLDSLKNVNNTFGHTIGDRILQNFAKRLSSCTRAGDTVARWGSDEFCVLLPHIKNTEDTVKLAQRLFDTLKQPFDIDRHQVQVKSSIGIAVYPQDGEEAETILKNADAALHRTKAQGRNHYQFYTPTLTTEASLLLKLETLLHQALDKKQFALHYQPQINLTTGEISGVEALLRWQHPEVGFLSPSKFIPLAEKTDLILHIGKWVLKTACEQNLAWQKDGLPPFPVAVNLSAREFQQPNLAEVVARILDETGLDPHWLELEITEAVLRQHQPKVQKTLRDLRTLGVRIALDDFGTGQSSLGYLQQFSFHTLKLDQAFMRDFRGNPQEKAIVSAVLALGRGFNLRVVAEGVETQQQLNSLQQLQWEEVQGYWFSHPLTSAEASQFLTQHWIKARDKDSQAKGALVLTLH